MLGFSLAANLVVIKTNTVLHCFNIGVDNGGTQMHDECNVSIERVRDLFCAQRSIVGDSDGHL